jgi:NAD-dependent histone deacetylase SIR2
MGNEESSMVDGSTRPSVLEGRNMEAVAKYIKECNVQRMVVMVCLTFFDHYSNIKC